VPIDVKFVEPIPGRVMRYQYTAIDDCTRLRVLRAYPRNNQKTAIQFVSLPARHTPTVVPASNTQHRSGVFE
jgi:hypothetical protein